MPAFRPFLLAALVLFSSPIVLSSQDAADPFLLEKLLPSDTILYLSIPNDPARGEDFRKSNLHNLLNHPEIRFFLEPFERYLAKRKNEDRERPGGTEPSWNRLLQHGIGLTIDELFRLLQGPIGFAVVDLPVNPEHTLDLVFTLGADDAGRLEESAAKFREAILKNNPSLEEGEYQFQGKTIRRIGDNELTLFHAVLGRTLIVATSQNRIEDLLSRKEAKPLASHDPFRTVCSHVSPDRNHLFLGYLSVDTILHRFRKEIGDATLEWMERIGLRDIPAVGASIRYALPHLQETLAIVTSRQDRGLVKLMAGRRTPDRAAAFVPSNAVEYTHSTASLTDAYDFLLDCASLDAETEQRVRKAIGEYEARVGVKIREDLLGSLGSSWTSYTAFPEAGGVIPDWVLACELADAKKFAAAVEAIAKDAGWTLDQSEFHGKTIRMLDVSFGRGADFVELDFPVTFPLAWYEQDGLLFLSWTPHSLKRQILRNEGHPGSVTDAAGFRESASRLPADARGFTYLDLGKIFTFGYNTVEPFLHFARDFTREPDTGEPILDLARLPLGETVGGLVGTAILSSRTGKDAIVVESFSNVAVSSLLFSQLFGTGLLFGFLFARAAAFEGHHRPDGMAFGPAENERLAELTLKTIRMAQDTFKNSDMDRNGVADYWTRDVAGLHSMKDRSDSEIVLIDPATAAADVSGARNYASLAQGAMPKHGYWFQALTRDPDGDAYAADPDKDGKSWTNETRWGVAAYPAAHGVTGNSTFLITEEGTIWKKETGGEAVVACPKDPAAEGWRASD